MESDASPSLDQQFEDTIQAIDVSSLTIYIVSLLPVLLGAAVEDIQSTLRAPQAVELCRNFILDPLVVTLFFLKFQKEGKLMIVDVGDFFAARFASGHSDARNVQRASLDIHC